jgi:hypothetical protein
MADIKSIIQETVKAFSGKLDRNDYHGAIEALQLGKLRVRDLNIPEAPDIITTLDGLIEDTRERANCAAEGRPSPDPKAGKYCTYCGTPLTNESKAVAGPGVLICGSCIARFNAAIPDRQGANREEPVDGTQNRRCAFCGNEPSAYREFFGGPAHYICVECVRLSSRSLQQESSN